MRALRHELIPPPCGEGRRARASRGGGFQRRHHRSWIFPVALTPPPDRRFAHSRCKASAFLFLRTATKGRLCTLPTLSRGRDKRVRVCARLANRERVLA